jgi:hypothetical protein
MVIAKVAILRDDDPTVCVRDLDNLSVVDALPFGRSLVWIAWWPTRFRKRASRTDGCTPRESSLGTERHDSMPTRSQRAVLQCGEKVLTL